MKIRISLVAGLIVVAGWVTPSSAEEKIQAYIGPDGKIVYTNVVENPTTMVAKAASAAMLPANGTQARIHALIDSIASNHGVDPALVKAIAKTESNFDRWAVSPKGALGLMQLIPDTGARFGVRDFFDPSQNIEGGVRYIKFLLAKFKGNVDLSLAAYNAGENLVERLGRIPSIPETRDYVRKVRLNYGKSSPRQAGFTPVAASAGAAAKEEQQIFRTVDERGVVHFSNIAPPK
jgi:soluble lytic murein transglycosylase-like protein